MGDEEAILTFSRHQPELLDTLYRAATDTGVWPKFLKALVDATQARSARLLVMDRQAERVHYSTKINIDDDEHQQYVDYYVNRCPWRPELILKPPGRFYSSYIDCQCTQEEFYKTEFFNDWARHLDIQHGLSGSVFTDSRFTVQLLIQRTGGQGYFSRQLAEHVNRNLAAHIRQVLHLGRTAVLQQRRNLSALAAAERSFMPFLLVDEQGRVHYCCASAMAAMDSMPGVSVEQDRLQFPHPNQQARFRKALARSFSGPTGDQQTLVFPTQGGRVPVRLLVTPILPGSISETFWPEARVAAVYVQNPATHLDIDRDVLARLFGLTHREARVAAAVSLGSDPKVLAERHEVSLHTVRTQLKSAMYKVGVHRQAELATRVIMSAAVRDRNQNSAPLILPD